MTRPFVSLVLPITMDARSLALAERSLLALRRQTSDDFEAVVVVDGGHEAVALDAWKRLGHHAPERVRFTSSPREPGHEHLPHRNHARNRGCAEAVGEYVWVLDGDIIASPFAVQHLRAVVHARTAAAPAVVTPCFAEPAFTPEGWLRRDGSLSGASHDERQLPLRRYTSSGYLNRYRPGPPATRRVPQLIEGFPAVPRWLWEALGGFDERFLGYGGNKVSFVRALTALDAQEGLIEVHLLTSCLFLHQPHERDPLRHDEAHRAANWALFNDYVAGIRTRAPWWCENVEAVRAAIATEARTR